MWLAPPPPYCLGQAMASQPRGELLVEVHHVGLFLVVAAEAAFHAAAGALFLRRELGGDEVADFAAECFDFRFVRESHRDGLGGCFVWREVYAFSGAAMEATAARAYRSAPWTLCGGHR